MSENDVLEVLAVLSEAYGNEPPSVTGYVWALEGYAASVLGQAARESAKRHAWYPKPAELRAICEEVRMKVIHDEQPDRESRSLRDQAYRAFDMLREGEISEDEFKRDKAVIWTHRQYGIFAGLFGKSPTR